MPRGNGLRSFDIARTLSVFLIFLALFLATRLQSPAERLTDYGFAVLMVAVAGHLFSLRGLPIPERPPVRFSAISIGFIILACAGLFAIGLGMTGYPAAPYWKTSPGAGRALMALAVLTMPGVALYLRSAPGRRYRDRLLQKAGAI